MILLAPNQDALFERCPKLGIAGGADALCLKHALLLMLTGDQPRPAAVGGHDLFSTEAVAAGLDKRAGNKGEEGK